MGSCVSHDCNQTSFTKKATFSKMEK